MTGQIDGRQQWQGMASYGREKMKKNGRKMCGHEINETR